MNNYGKICKAISDDIDKQDILLKEYLNNALWGAAGEQSEFIKGMKRALKLIIEVMR